MYTYTECYNVLQQKEHLNQFKTYFCVLSIYDIYAKLTSLSKIFIGPPQTAS